MSNQDRGNEAGLVPVAPRDLTPVAATNPLVVRGIVDLTKELPDCDPSDEPLLKMISAKVRRLRLENRRLVRWAAENLPPPDPESRHPYDLAVTAYRAVVLMLLDLQQQHSEREVPPQDGAAPASSTNEPGTPLSPPE